VAKPGNLQTKQLLSVVREHWREKHFHISVFKAIMQLYDIYFQLIKWGYLCMAQYILPFLGLPSGRGHVKTVS
jgi:hypothetical protein